MRRRTADHLQYDLFRLGDAQPLDYGRYRRDLHADVRVEPLAGLEHEWHLHAPRQSGAAHAMSKFFRLRRDELGAAAVEFALTVPVLITMIYGIFEFSQLYEANAGMQH